MVKRSQHPRICAPLLLTLLLLPPLPNQAHAQSNASGAIFGKVDAAEDSSLNFVNLDSGFKRSISLDATGRFRVSSLPVGRYKVELLRKGKVVSATEVSVVVGQGVQANFNGQGTEQLQVTAKRKRLDTSTVHNGSSFEAKELAQLPIQTNVSAIVQLAPNTTNADPRYAGGASFGGGGASENAYYINGFPVTNPLSQLGASELPFGAIAQAQVLTGGYGAEFGRSVGGLVNITSKSGTNEWETGGTLSVDLPSLAAKRRDIYYPNTGSNPETDGSIYLRRSQTKTSRQNIAAYVGGPILEDKLLMFLAVDDIRTTTSGVNLNRAANETANGRTGWSENESETLRYLAKLDWNVADDHRLEWTQIGDRSTSDIELSGYDYASDSRTHEVSSRQHYTNMAGTTPAVGADTSIVKYTGNFTENLTSTVLYGQSRTPRLNSFDGYDINTELYQVVAAPRARAPGIDYNNPQPLTGNITPPGAYDAVKSLRLDLEYKWREHTLRAGLDKNELRSHNAGQIIAGGGSWTYLKTDTPDTPITLGGESVAVSSGGGLGTQGYYVRKNFFSSATEAFSNQSAQYIEDRYQATDDLLLIMGLRNEQFTNLNGDKVAFIKMNNQVAPRFGASWDVYGDSSTKIFGSAGRYHLQMPTRLAVRGASRSTNTREFFTYTGVDENGVPQGRVPLTSGPYSANNEYGQAKDVNVLAAQGLKPTYQDEVTLGLEQVLTPTWNFGVKGTWRVLQSTIDDVCDARPFEAWADRNGVDRSNWGGFGCAFFNPGEDNEFLVDFAGTQSNYSRVRLSRADLGFPKAERIYKALDFYLEHPFSDSWYGRINYTWSQSRGNTEGQTLSDIGQADVAATQAWDFPELMQYAKGRLPNDRTHQLKAYGFRDLFKDWTVGGNFVYESGRPRSCLGNNPDNDPYDYGSAYHYCNGSPSPRGKSGQLPAHVRLDTNLAHRPEFLPGLLFKLDVFNVFNRQSVQAVDEVSNNDDGTIAATYGRVVGYTAPRSVRLTAEYARKF